MFFPSPIKKGKVVLTQYGDLSFPLLVRIVKHSGVPLPTSDSKQIKNSIWLSRTLANVTGEYFADELLSNHAEKGMKLR